jgi:hypothetical protein
MREEHAELRDLENALSGLAPRCDIDRSKLLFEAGRASAPRSWGWTVAAFSWMTTAVFGLLLVSRPGPVERVLHVPIDRPTPAPVRPPPPSPPPLPRPSPDSARTTEGPVAWQPGSDELRLRDHLLHWGLDGLPSPGPASAEPTETPGSFLRAN